MTNTDADYTNTNGQLLRMTMKSETALHHILRTFLPENALESRTRDLLDYCRRTGCNEVLLFTTSYDEAPSFVHPDQVRTYVEKLRLYVERIRAAGITVSLNVMQTLGHIYFPLAMEKDFPFHRRVSTSGKVSTEGACPCCPKLQDWVAETYGIYAGLQPRVMLVDDDFRTFMQALTCLCDDHLADISRRAGRPVTRQQVEAAIYDNRWPASDLRQHYFDSTTEGYCQVAASIRQAVQAVSPETRLGVMNASFPVGVIGLDWPKILSALCGENTPIVRPQTPMYFEHNPRELAAAFSNPSLFRSVLPGNIEFWPEIENYSFTTWSKSTQCTFAQMASAVLQGFDHLALNIFDFYDSPYADSEPVIEMLESRKPVLDALHRLIPEGNRPEGIYAYAHADEMRVRRVPEGTNDLSGSLKFTSVLPNLGLPVGYGQPSSWVFITGDDVLAATDAEIDKLLKKGAVLDPTGLESLALRGFEDRIGIRAGRAIPEDELGYEDFCHPETSPRLCGRRHPLRALIAPGDCRYLEDVSGCGRPASVIRNYRREAVAPAVLLTENSRGERFAVLAWSGKGSPQQNENLYRAEQFRELFGWVGRRPLPVAVDERMPFVWPILNRTADGRHVLGLINLSTDTYQELPLLMETVPASLHRLAADGTLMAAKFRVEPGNSGCVRVAVEGESAPLSVTVLVYSHGNDH